MKRDGVERVVETPSTVKRFVVTADVHDNAHMMRVVGEDFDFQLIAGDLTNKGDVSEFFGVF